MIFSVGKNMPERRERAKAEVDVIFALRLQQRPVDALHAAKLVEAKRVVDGGSSAALEREAGQRGVSADDLARTIIEKHEIGTQAALLAMESDRQDALAAIRESKRPEDIDAVLDGLRPTETDFLA